MRKRAMLALLLILSILLALPVSATETEGTEAAAPVQSAPVEIYTVEDLRAIAEDPAGSYILMADLDMTGIGWKAIDFSGSFDGNGYAILNLTLAEPGKEKPDSCDGNRKLYETTYFGLFGTMRNAEVKDLQLLNVRAVVEYDSPVFVAGIAGYAENCTITGCTVTGTLELRAHDRMFGVGGIVGYGSGSVEDCTVDVTLINTDTDAQTRDEQFLGGIYATGFMDVKNCDVTLDGYISDHGYVHSGGIVGMYMEYPLGIGIAGYVTGNTVNGKITFFEDNYDRRAYCSAYVGEALVSRYYLDKNSGDFLRDERWEYDTELRPEMCEAPVYTENIVAPGCDTYGYTEYACDSCGYTYTDHYTLPQHTVTVWTITEEPTTELEGLSVGYCDGCGLEFTRTEPKLEVVPTTTAAPTEATEPATQPPETQPVQQAPEQEDKSLPILIGVDIALAVTAVLIIRKLARPSRRKRKFHR